jgi:hypothetical protein
VEELPDLRRTLRTKSLGKNGVGQRGDRGITSESFDNDEGKDGDIGSDDAAANRFASTSVAGLSVRSLTRLGKRTPCFIGNPCLSLPPVMRKMYPFHSSPRESPGTFLALFSCRKIYG